MKENFSLWRYVRRTLGMALCAAAFTTSFTACFDQHPIVEESEETAEEDSGYVYLNIQVMADGSTTRATDIATLAELWIYDFADGELAQVIHQLPADADYAAPTMKLAYGNHQLRFISGKNAATRGTATGDGGDELETLVWSKLNDTFAAALNVNVASGVTIPSTVTLQRIASRATLTIADEIPATAQTLTCTASAMSRELDVLTLTAVELMSDDREVSIASAAGKTGIAISFWTLCPDADEWQTDLNLAVTSATATLTHVTLTDVPIRQNRTTTVTGNLFGREDNLTVSVDDSWSTGKDVAF